MSRTVPTGARPEWPHDPERSQGYPRGRSVPRNGYDDQYGNSGYDDEAYRGNGQQYGDGQAYGYANGQGQAAYPGQQYPGQQYPGQAYPGQQYGGRGYDGQAYPAHGGYDRPDDYDQPRYGQGQAGQAGYAQGYREQPTQAYGSGGYGDQSTQAWYDDPRSLSGQGYGGQGYDSQGLEEPGYDAGGQNRGRPGRPGAAGATRPGATRPGGPGRPGRPGRPGGPLQPGAGPGSPVRFRRLRRLAKKRSFRIGGAIFAIFFLWFAFSLGQATFKNNGQGALANAAEWFRDHGMGFAITWGEQLTYSAPKAGGKPTLNYTVPKGEGVTQAKKKAGGFQPDIPAPLKPLASGPALPGEGQWRVLEKVKGNPAILMTLLRDGGVYTSYSNAVASIDQRLVKFSLRPGTEDPGAANWGVPNYIPAGQRKGLLATFNGGFKLDAAEGGFYLNGIYHGSLVNGAASVVYYKNGTIKIGEWGRDFHMNASIVGVRQNLKLLVDHGKTMSNANLSVQSNWGATLGGSFWVWRSGLGITKDGRIVYVYGEKLDAQDLAKLLQRAGAVEGMQLDINPAWMKFDYYVAKGNPGNPTPTPLLPIQQPDPASYLTPSTRDFTAVYAR